VGPAADGRVHAPRRSGDRGSRPRRRPLPLDAGLPLWVYPPAVLAFSPRRCSICGPSSPTGSSEHRRRAAGAAGHRTIDRGPYAILRHPGLFSGIHLMDWRSRWSWDRSGRSRVGPRRGGFAPPGGLEDRRLARRTAGVRRLRRAGALPLGPRASGRRPPGCSRARGRPFRGTLVHGQRQFSQARQTTSITSAWAAKATRRKARGAASSAEPVQAETPPGARACR